MENEKTWYERFEEKLQVQLSEQEFGSEKYYKTLDVLNRVQEMKTREEKANNDNYYSYNKDQRELKSERRRFILDILKIAVPVGGMLLMLVLTMIFEQKGYLISPRFLNMIIKPKIG